MEYMQIFVGVLRLGKLTTSDTIQSFQCAGCKSNMPNVLRSGISVTRLQAAQVRKFCTGSTVLRFSITGDGVDPSPRFWSFVFAQETCRLNLEASLSIAERAVQNFQHCTCPLFNRWLAFRAPLYNQLHIHSYKLKAVVNVIFRMFGQKAHKRGPWLPALARMGRYENRRTPQTTAGLS